MDQQGITDKKRVAYLLVGPTAVGKTAVAQWIAEHKGWQILSADSMLVYRGMDIGTAKPSQDELNRVKYWGVDIVDPSEFFSVAKYLSEAQRCLDCIPPKQDLIIVGGTGLYLRALMEGLEAGSVESSSRRSQWQELFDAQGIDGLRRALMERNIGWYESLSVADKSNSRRLIRALEGHEAGILCPPKSWRKAEESPNVVGLSMEREDLVVRIEERVQAMYRDGLLAETKELINRGREWSVTAAHAIGYEEAAACLRGDISRMEAIERTVVRTRQLVKRQMTWFRGQMAVRWVNVNPQTSVKDAARAVLEAWNVTGPTPLGV
jgi:tRNA dimethylallyltransferase